MVSRERVFGQRELKANRLSGHAVRARPHSSSPARPGTSKLGVAVPLSQEATSAERNASWQTRSLRVPRGTRRAKQQVDSFVRVAALAVQFNLPDEHRDYALVYDAQETTAGRAPIRRAPVLIRSDNR